MKQFDVSVNYSLLAILLYNRGSSIKKRKVQLVIYRGIFGLNLI